VDSDLPSKLYRLMFKEADGLPQVGETFAQLGVRPLIDGVNIHNNENTDIEVNLGFVDTGKKGMSCLIKDSIFHLKKNPELETESLKMGYFHINPKIFIEMDLNCIPTNKKKRHFSVPPKFKMLYIHYKTSLESTRSKWEEVWTNQSENI
jgi:hypothetical protein